MARPMAASPAATVSTKSANTWPTRSPMNEEKATRLMLTASSMSSTDIRMTMTFLRLRKIPKMPSVNRMAATVRWGQGAIGATATTPPLGPGRDDRATGGKVDHVDCRVLAARHLGRNRLAFHSLLVPERQHDGADHGDEENEPRALEIVGILGIEHPTDRLGVGDTRASRGNRGGGQSQRTGLKHTEAHHHDELAKENETDNGAERCILDKASPQLREVDVKHHDDEQEQHGHRSDVHND